MSNRRTYITVALVLVLVLAGGLSGAAQAQEQNRTDSPNAEIYDQLGSLIVESVDYDGAQFDITVRWTGSLTQQVSLTELIELDGSGSQGISIQETRVVPGESTTITISASSSGGTAAVILSTKESLDNGNALVIQSGSPTTREPVPFDIAGLFVALTAAGTFGVGISILYRRRNKDESQRGRVL